MWTKCVEGNIEEDWFIPLKDRIGWWDFYDRLAVQQLQYALRNIMYPRDSTFKDYTC